MLSNNWCWYSGGGAFNSSLTNCTIFSNAAGDGGGVCQATLFNCLLVSNVASIGGGADFSSLFNCTVVGNRVNNIFDAGGVEGHSRPSFVFNCIVYSNFSTAVSNCGANVTVQNSCTWPLPANGAHNFTNAPLLVNYSNDFHLQSNSPCINAGNNAYVSNNLDFGGQPRIAGGTVDVGAYEYPTPASVISYAWLQQYGLATDGSADFADADGDHASNYAEWKTGTNPTNALSLLQLQPPVSSNTVNGVVVTWQSVTGLNYFLQRSSALTQPFSAIQSNLPGQPGTTSYTDISATNGGPWFYRVGVQ